MIKNPQVLVVEQDPDERAGLCKQLALSGFVVVGHSGFGVEAVTMAVDLGPDLIVIGIEEPVARGLHTLDNLAMRAPSAVKVVLSSLMDSVYLRKAMLAGAIEYLDRNTSPGDLATALVVALERESRRRDHGVEQVDHVTQGSIVTIICPKGGIGKTTISTNLAVAVAAHCEERVAIVDLDSRFGDVAVLLDIEPHVTIVDLVRDLATVDRMSIQQYLTPHSSGAMVLAAPRRPSEWITITPSQIGRVLHLLAEVFDTVIVDTPGTFNDVIGRALQVSNLVFLLTSPDTASTKDAMIALELMRSWDFDNDKVKLLVNYPHEPGVLRDQHVAEALGYPVYWTLPYDKRLAKFSQDGKPIVLDAPTSTLAKSLIHLAYNITGEKGPKTAEKSPISITTFRQRLAGLLAG